MIIIMNLQLSNCKKLQTKSYTSDLSKLSKAQAKSMLKPSNPPRKKFYLSASFNKKKQLSLVSSLSII